MNRDPEKSLIRTLTIGFSGEKDGTAGYTYSRRREINRDGYQKITSVLAEDVGIDLVFTDPFESTSKINFTLNEVKEGIEVIWTMDGSMPVPGNAFF